MVDTITRTDDDKQLISHPSGTCRVLEAAHRSALVQSQAKCRILVILTCEICWKILV